MRSAGSRLQILDREICGVADRVVVDCAGPCRHLQMPGAQSDRPSKLEALKVAVLDPTETCYHGSPLRSVQGSSRGLHFGESAQA